MFLKCTWDFVSIKVGQDQQIGRGLPVRRETVAPSSQEEWRAAPCRATRGSSRRQKACRESRCQGLYHGFHRKRWVTQDRQMGSVGVNNLTALWGVGTSPSCLVPGSGALWGQGERVAWLAGSLQVWALDWLVCIWKPRSQGSHFLSLEMSQLWEEQALQDEQHLSGHNIKKTQLTQNTVYKRWDSWTKLRLKKIQVNILTFYINSPFTLTPGWVET